MRLKKIYVIFFALVVISFFISNVFANPPFPPSSPPPPEECVISNNGIEICDSLDNDCDGFIDNNLAVSLCANQIGVCENSAKNCVNGEWQECDSANYGQDYEEIEISCDGMDNDCDSFSDENLISPFCANQIGVCEGSTKICGGFLGWLSCDSINYGLDYEVNETTCDILDNDCDGSVDESCACVSNQTQSCGSSDVGLCTFGTQVCSNFSWTECNATLSIPEICGNSLDEDCDGIADNGCSVETPLTDSCFPAGTLISMADGSLKNIEDVKIGEKVLSYNGKRIVKSNVLEIESPVRDNLYEITFNDGTKLDLTREHPIYTKKGWESINPSETLKENSNLDVNILNVGDFVLNSNLNFVEISSIKDISKGNIQTYNLKEISKTNAFFAEGYLVHNKGGSPSGGTPSGGNIGLSTKECNDDEDNDEDGYIDYPYDSGCDSTNDNNESDELVFPIQNLASVFQGNSYIDWTFNNGSVVGIITTDETYLAFIKGTMNQENFNLIKSSSLELSQVISLTFPSRYSVIEYLPFENIREAYFDEISLTFYLDESLLNSENETLQFALLKFRGDDKWKEFSLKKRRVDYTFYLKGEHYLSPIILATKVKEKSNFGKLISNYTYVIILIIAILIIIIAILFAKRTKRRKI